jgi:hypothetical protein
MEKLRIAQEQELKTLRNAQRSGKGLLSIAQETVMGRSTDAEELLNRTLSFLRDARNLLEADQEEQALQALSVYLKVRVKEVQPLFIQARSIIEREEHEESLRRARLEEEERLRLAREEREERLRREQAEREERLERLRLEHEAFIAKTKAEENERLARIQAEKEERLRQEREAEEERLRNEQAEKEERLRQVRLRQEEQRISQSNGSEEGLLKGLQGSDTVTVEQASQVLGHEDTRYVVRLRNEGTLKHKPKREDLITVASLRAYLAKHPKRTPLVAIRPNEEEVVTQDTEAIA